MDMRPEQELVVKYEGWLFRVLRRGTIGVSIVPFGDLSISVDAIAAIVAAFLFSNSIDLRIWVPLLFLAACFFGSPTRPGFRIGVTCVLVKMPLPKAPGLEEASILLWIYFCGIIFIVFASL